MGNTKITVQKKIVKKKRLQSKRNVSILNKILPKTDLATETKQNNPISIQ